VLNGTASQEGEVEYLLLLLLLDTTSTSSSCCVHHGCYDGTRAVKLLMLMYTLWISVMKRERCESGCERDRKSTGVGSGGHLLWAGNSKLLFKRVLLQLV
jgi:hypothetical protein